MLSVTASRLRDAPWPPAQHDLAEPDLRSSEPFANNRRHPVSPVLLRARHSFAASSVAPLHVVRLSQSPDEQAR